MKKDSITLTITSTIKDHHLAIGYLYVYRSLDNSESEKLVDIEFDYQPEEPMTQEVPGSPADVTVTRITDAATGQIEYQIQEIDNILDVESKILEEMEHD